MGKLTSVIQRFLETRGGEWTKTKSQTLEGVEAGAEEREVEREGGGEQTVDGEAEEEEEEVVCNL